jgi:hypothetical protein
VAHAPFFQQTRTFLIAVRDSGGIKMTAKGQLSRSIGLLKGQLKLRKKTLRLLEPESAGLLDKILFIAFFKEYNIGYRFNRGVDFD